MKTKFISSLALAGVLLFQLMAVSGNAQVVSASTNQPGSNQIWDNYDQLKFTAEQRATADRIHADLEAAKSAMEAGTATNTPPDVSREARITYGKKVRALRTELSNLLTDEQKTAYDDLRAARRKSPRAKSSTNATETASAEASSEDKSPGEISSTSKTRPKLTDAEYLKQAAELRAVYSQSPEHWPAPNLDDEAKTNFAELGLLPPVKYPTNNPYSDAKAELGKRLFFDPRISGSSQIACASCHDPDIAWTDGRTASFGHSRKLLKRNAPMILNSGHLKTPFWDGRVDSLEQQAAAVLNNEDEMRSGATLVSERLLSIDGYTNQFTQAFGTPEATITRASQAIATFERTINSRSNPFDNFLRGDTNALNDSAVRGLNLFRTTARCINCHNGPNFTDSRFHNEGLTYYGRTFEDLGRYKVTQLPEDVGRFKTPSLRNISRTGPYMHNGLFDLDGVLAMYNAGMPNVRPMPKQKNDPLFPKKSALLKPLGLNAQDIADLKAFLDSLTEARFRVRPPEPF